MSSKYIYFTEETYVGETPPAGEYDLCIITAPLSSTTLTENLSSYQTTSSNSFGETAILT